jgi:hypothetical protein
MCKNNDMNFEVKKSKIYLCINRAKYYFRKFVTSVFILIFDRKKEKYIRLIMRHKGGPLNIAIGLSNNIKCYKKSVVCIKENGVIHKVVSVKSGSDGSINVLFPYSNNKEAYVFQYTHSYKPGIVKIPKECVVKDYIVNEESKLSIHKSGFVQLSGRGIISEINKLDGKPGGIGLFSNPLDYPVFTGPTFGFQCWGVGNNFSKLTKYKNNTQYIILDSNDFYPEIIKENGEKKINSYALEFWIFPKQANNHVYEFDKKPFINHVIGNYIYEPGVNFTHPVLDINGFDGVLALLPKKHWCQYADESNSGYILSSPGGLGSKYEKSTKTKNSFMLICPRKPNWLKFSDNPQELKY